MFIDLLTYADLEALKNKRRVAPRPPGRPARAKQQEPSSSVAADATASLPATPPLRGSTERGVPQRDGGEAQAEARLAAAAGVGKGDSSGSAPKARAPRREQAAATEGEAAEAGPVQSGEVGDGGQRGAVELSTVRGSTDSAFASSTSASRWTTSGRAQGCEQGVGVVRRERGSLSRQLQQKTELASVEASRRGCCEQTARAEGRRGCWQAAGDGEGAEDQGEGPHHPVRRPGRGLRAAGTAHSRRAPGPRPARLRPRSPGSGTPRASYGLDPAPPPRRSGTPSVPGRGPRRGRRARSQSPPLRTGSGRPRAPDPHRRDRTRVAGPRPARSGRLQIRSPRREEKRERDAARFRNSAGGIARGLASPNRMRPWVPRGGGYYTPGGGARGASPARGF